MAFCLQCGAALADGVKFCTECGTPVTEEVIPQDTPQPGPKPGPKLAPGRMFSPKKAVPAAPITPSPAPAAPARPIAQETVTPAAAPRQPTPTNSASAKNPYTVVLKKYNSNKMKAIIKEVRRITGLDMDSAKTLVGSLPATLKTGVTQREAEQIKEALVSAGGVIDVHR